LDEIVRFYEMGRCVRGTRWATTAFIGKPSPRLSLPTASGSGVFRCGRDARQQSSLPQRLTN